jgi:hypothetical protein
MVLSTDALLSHAYPPTGCMAGSFRHWGGRGEGNYQLDGSWLWYAWNENSQLMCIRWEIRAAACMCWNRQGIGKLAVACGGMDWMDG